MGRAVLTSGHAPSLGADRRRRELHTRGGAGLCRAHLTPPTPSHTRTPPPTRSIHRCRIGTTDWRRAPPGGSCPEWWCSTTHTAGRQGGRRMQNAGAALACDPLPHDPRPPPAHAAQHGGVSRLWARPLSWTSRPRRSRAACTAGRSSGRWKGRVRQRRWRGARACRRQARQRVIPWPACCIRCFECVGFAWLSPRRSRPGWYPCRGTPQQGSSCRRGCTAACGRRWS